MSENGDPNGQGNIIYPATEWNANDYANIITISAAAISSVLLVIFKSRCKTIDLCWGLVNCLRDPIEEETKKIMKITIITIIITIIIIMKTTIIMLLIQVLPPLLLPKTSHSVLGERIILSDIRT